MRKKKKCILKIYRNKCVPEKTINIVLKLHRLCVQEDNKLTRNSMN